MQGNVSEEKPDLQWLRFAGWCMIAITFVATGIFADWLLNHGPVWAGSTLGALPLAFLFALVARGRNDGEFETSIKVTASTTAGLWTVFFLVFMRVASPVTNNDGLPLLTAPGLYMAEWLLTAQYARWRFARGPGA
ncbi:MAG: hypothetical protein WA989_02955 [Henriciella sp.]|uniref:hypothetical protein n=1 Tax=Henriciella sp. TaxID=1968823 RepID=UPI003C77336C